MYQAHWGLQTSPFRGCADPALFHQSPTHEEALARLEFLVAEHRRLGLLVGPPGSGKSMLLEVFAAHGRRHGWPVALVSMLDVEPTEMLWLLASQWGLSLQPAATAASLWRALGDLLIASRHQQLAMVVLADDVDQADPAVLQHLARLARFDPSAQSRLTIVLAGRNEGMSWLGEPLMGLAELRIALEPWQREDTEDYLTTMLAQAGRQSPVFTEQAIDRLHAITGGTPRRVSQLAELALVAGAGGNLQQIDANVVESAYQELGVGAL
jgi:type II secretory pathway predicted ATPase ExeA